VLCLGLLLSLLLCHVLRSPSRSFRRSGWCLRTSSEMVVEPKLVRVESRLVLAWLRLVIIVWLFHCFIVCFIVSLCHGFIVIVSLFVSLFV
jgi:hypothetical protein